MSGNSSQAEERKMSKWGQPKQFVTLREAAIATGLNVYDFQFWIDNKRLLEGKHFQRDRKGEILLDFRAWQNWLTDPHKPGPTPEPKRKAPRRDLPAQLYRHFDSKGRLLYVGISTSAIARMQGHKHHSGWFAKIATFTVTHYPTREECLAAEEKAIREEKPLHNIVHARDQ